MFVATTAQKQSSSVTQSNSSSVGRGGALGALGDEIGSARVGGRDGLHENETTNGWWSRGEGEGGWRRRFRVPERMKVKLVSLWAVSHLMLAACLLGTL
jgi:solute carrier family 45, member 1/2/4